MVRKTNRTCTNNGQTDYVDQLALSMAVLGLISWSYQEKNGLTGHTILLLV